VDTLDYARETGPRGVTGDLTAGTAADTFGDTDTLRLTSYRYDYNAPNGAPTYGSDNGPFENVKLTRHDDVATGNDAANRLYGFQGNDILRGAGGDDTLVGGHGQDSLTGGAGADGFGLHSDKAPPLGTPDTINDFATGTDTIDLRGLLSTGDQPLKRADAADLDAGFTRVAGQVRYADGRLTADIDGDGTADFEVIVHSASNTAAQLAAGDVLFG
jgi:Ca2+-binding RTX toxin-like protein